MKQKYEIFFSKDCDLSLLKKRKICVVGYGAQGKAHADNLKDSGISVVVGLRHNSNLWNKATAYGHQVKTIKEAVTTSDFVILLIPDECHGEVYREHIHDNLAPKSTLAFAHGFSIHYKQIQPKDTVDVVMIAPKAQGMSVRSLYLEGKGAPSLIAVQQDITGKAKSLALAYAQAIGSGHAGILETTFKNETETDLFGEQAVLCGGLIELVKAGFEILTEAGYPPEIAYFECFYELKLIVDLMHQKGMLATSSVISNNAEFGACITGTEIINETSRKAMRHALLNIKSGAYAKKFADEESSGYKQIKKYRDSIKNHPLEKIDSLLKTSMNLS